MEGSEEVIGGTSKDVAYIVKGKRTKRQRPQSPIPFTITSHLSSSNGDQTNNNNNYSSPSQASSDELATSTTTEDEDTARLLILLAQGQSRESSTKNNHDHYNQDHRDQDYGTTLSVKFNSKRYIETSSTVNGKAGMYVYECKTCNRTFPSFQALGGHRASHKKPKNMAAIAIAEEKKQSFVYADEDEAPFRSNNNNNSVSHITYQLSNINSNTIKSSSSPKIHECSYCGAEFTSGQALGGHMRRHRGANTTVTNTALSLSPISPNISVNQDSDEAKKLRSNGGFESDEAKKLRKNDGLSLSLDLNLPAPEDDHNKFAFVVKQQQHQQQPRQNQQQPQQQNKEPTLVLSTTPTLVDCQY